MVKQKHPFLLFQNFDLIFGVLPNVSLYGNEFLLLSPPSSFFSLSYERKPVLNIPFVFNPVRTMIFQEFTQLNQGGESDDGAL